MRTALHRITRQVLTAARYEEFYGKPVDGEGNERHRDYALCDICDQDVYLRAEHSQYRIPNFSHLGNSSFCPAKDFNAEAYRRLNPVDADPQAALALKTAFFTTWKFHWVEFNRIIQYASVFDFSKVLKYANRHGMWGYRGMRVQDVLAVLLTLMDFMPLPKEKRYLRDYGFRFFYKGSVSNTNEYWNLPESTRSLIQVKYEFPGKTSTFQEVNISSKNDVIFDPEFLTGVYLEEPPVHSFVEKFMTKEFPNLVGR
ncbi:hypothetical protein [Pseudomonas sp. CHM02]|uniref:hypothetical protein n=1 Tax=Pseudomonas sp. CHM02 TaxID=1463662 RepID=UPI000472A904|nr:hypothetical protein [Pseudomonas sp. CHM02]